MIVQQEAIKVTVPMSPYVRTQPFNLNRHANYQFVEPHTPYNDTNFDDTERLNEIDYRRIGNNYVTEDTIKDSHAIMTESLEFFEKLASEIGEDNIYESAMPTLNYGVYVAGGARMENLLHRETVQQTFQKTTFNVELNPFWEMVLGPWRRSLEELPSYQRLNDGYFGFGPAIDKWNELKEEMTSGWDFRDMDWGEAELFMRDPWGLMGPPGSPKQGPLRVTPRPSRPPRQLAFLPPVDDVYSYNSKNKVVEQFVEAENLNLDLTQQLHNKRATSIQHILNSGADFLKHMYDAILVCYREAGAGGPEAEHEDFFELFFKSDFLGAIEPMVTNSVFMVRNASITVPQMESDVFNVKLGFETIQKVRTKVKYERKAELKVLLDEPLYFMGIFNLLSNNNRVVFDGVSVNNRHPKGFTPFTTNRIVSEYIIAKKIRIDLIIKHQQLMKNDLLDKYRNQWRTGRTGSYGSTDNLVFGHAGLLPEEMPLWWFEDLKFLGQKDGLQFNNEKGEIQEMGFPFIFKRCIRVDRQFRHGTGQTEQFNKENLVDTELRFIDENHLKRHFGDVSNQDYYYKEID